MPVKKKGLAKLEQQLSEWEDGGKDVYARGARWRAEYLRITYQSYLNAGFTPEDAMRLLLQDHLIDKSGNRAIVQGLSFSDLLKHQHTPETIP